MDLDLIKPDWPAPARVRAYATTRAGGVSQGLYAGLNLASHVGDAPAAVMYNRALLADRLQRTPLWLQQVHGVAVADADAALPETEADAAVARHAGKVCTVMTADCLPVLFCDRTATVVGAAHAGWRGLAGGVLENTVRAMTVPGEEILAWLGPAIAQTAFEVGDEVRTAFLAHDPQASEAFRPGMAAGKWQADLYALARRRLAAIGVRQVFGGGRCTFAESDLFFSARRDGTLSGRQASLIWLDHDETLRGRE